ncbi:hypothetical protein DFH09DRAFT_1285672 [Mycena vulgaris]|nr:hypothetical protein DFH09DRAFT_1285672 [Mycena vulgaris]
MTTTVPAFTLPQRKLLSFTRQHTPEGEPSTVTCAAQRSHMALKLFNNFLRPCLASPRLTRFDMQRDYPAATRPLWRSPPNTTPTRSTLLAPTPNTTRSITPMRSNRRRVFHSPPRLPRIRAPCDHSQRYLIPHRSTLAPAGHLGPTGTTTRSRAARRARSPSPMPPACPLALRDHLQRSTVLASATPAPTPVRASPPPACAAPAVALYPRAPSQLAPARTSRPLLARACRATRCDPHPQPAQYSIAYPACVSSLLASAPQPHHARAGTQRMDDTLTQLVESRTGRDYLVLKILRGRPLRNCEKYYFLLVKTAQGGTLRVALWHCSLGSLTRVFWRLGTAGDAGLAGTRYIPVGKRDEFRRDRFVVAVPGPVHQIEIAVQRSNAEKYTMYTLRKVWVTLAGHGKARGDPRDGMGIELVLGSGGESDPAMGEGKEE